MYKPYTYSTSISKGLGCKYKVGDLSLECLGLIQWTAGGSREAMVRREEPRAVKFPQIHLLMLEVSRSRDYRTLQARSNRGPVMIPAYGSSGCQCHPDLENKGNHESENSSGLLPLYYFRE